MLKFSAVAVCFAMLTLNSIAQVDTVPQKRFNHFVGLQANELLKQILNLSDDATEIQNPFLLTYAIESTKIGFGLHIGIGYDYTKTLDKDPVNRETKVNDFNYRVGIEKRFGIGKRFFTSVSFDYVGGNKLDKTFSVSVTNLGSFVDSSVTTTSEKTVSSGFGPRASLGFHISDHVILSTEASYYFTKHNKKENIQITDTQTDIFGGTPPVISTSNDNQETETTDFNMAIPIVLYLTIKF